MVLAARLSKDNALPEMATTRSRVLHKYAAQSSALVDGECFIKRKVQQKLELKVHVLSLSTTQQQENMTAITRVFRCCRRCRMLQIITDTTITGE